MSDEDHVFRRLRDFGVRLARIEKRLELDASLSKIEKRRGADPLGPQRRRIKRRLAYANVTPSRKDA